MGLMVGSGLRSVIRQRMVGLHIKHYRIITVDPDLAMEARLNMAKKTIDGAHYKNKQVFPFESFVTNILVHISPLKKVDV